MKKIQGMSSAKLPALVPFWGCELLCWQSRWFLVLVIQLCAFRQL